MANECCQRSKNALKRKYTSHYFVSADDNTSIYDYDFETKDENAFVQARKTAGNDINVISHE